MELQCLFSICRSIWGQLLKVDSWVPSLFLTSASLVIGRLEANLGDQVGDGGDGGDYEHGQDADKDEDHRVVMIAKMTEFSSPHQPLFSNFHLVHN